MSLPRYLPAFVLGELATAEFSVAVRQPAGAEPEFDVLDERGDAIGYLRVAPDGLHLSGPYLEALGTIGQDGSVRFEDEGREVLLIETTGDQVAVTVPDRRVAVRLAAGVAAALTRSAG